MASADPRSQLLDHLEGLAAYNDKGFRWAGHGAEDVRRNRRQAQRVIDDLVSEIGEGAFSRDLLHQLRSGAATTDSLGAIERLARAELKPERHG